VKSEYVIQCAVRSVSGIIFCKCSKVFKLAIVDKYVFQRLLRDVLREGGREGGREYFFFNAY
jgi:hypothetical protein